MQSDMKFQFPQEIKDVLGALADDTRWDILEVIINSDNEMAYSEIKKVLKVPDGKKGTLNYHLKELQKAGWIRNYIENKEGTRNKSFYALSKFAQKIIEGALQAMNRKSYPKKNLEITLNLPDAKNYIKNPLTKISNKEFERDYRKYLEFEIANTEQPEKSAKSFGIISDTYIRTSPDTIHEQVQQPVEIDPIRQSRNWNPSSETEDIEGKNGLCAASIRRTRMKVSQV